MGHWGRQRETTCFISFNLKDLFETQKTEFLEEFLWWKRAINDLI